MITPLQILSRVSLVSNIVQRKQSRFVFLIWFCQGVIPLPPLQVAQISTAFLTQTLWMCVSLGYAPHRTAHPWFLHSWRGWSYRVRVLKRLTAAYLAFPGFSLSIFNCDTPSVVPLTDWPRSSVSEAPSMPLSQLDPGHVGQQIPTSWQFQNYVRLQTCVNMFHLLAFLQRDWHTYFTVLWQISHLYQQPVSLA